MYRPGLDYFKPGVVHSRLVDGTVNNNCLYIINDTGQMFRVKSAARQHLSPGLKVRFVENRNKFRGEYWAGEIWIPRAGKPGNMSYFRV